MKNYDYIPRKARITARTGLTDTTVSLRLKFADGKPFHFYPGQFVMISDLGFGEVPLTITTDPAQKEIEVAVRSAGMVSQKLCSLVVGDSVYVNGPFGNGFTLSALKSKDVVIIAGGIGLAPLRSLIQHIIKEPKLVKSLTVLIGAKSPEYLIYKDEYEEWGKYAEVIPTVDKCGPKWRGHVGNVTKLFDKTTVKRGSAMIVCGPPVMYKPIVLRYAGKTISEDDLYFVLERKMKCGVGKCQHCTCGKLYVCQDGPVFAYSDIKYNQEAL
jgi:sulfhydrogenase subunit gamma (sulfur reductase)